MRSDQQDWVNRFSLKLVTSILEEIDRMRSIYGESAVQEWAWINTITNYINEWYSSIPNYNDEIDFIFTKFDVYGEVLRDRMTK